MKFNNKRFIILDTETTGRIYTEHKIVEIGCVEIFNGVKTDRTFQTYCNPERDMDPEATSINNITNEMLNDKPIFKDIAQDFLNFLNFKNNIDEENAIIVAHNAIFDSNFLEKELKIASQLLYNNFLNFEVIDTLFIAKKKYPGEKVGLDALCKKFNIDTSNRIKFGHGALLDSHLLADVFLKLLEESDIKKILLKNNNFFVFAKHHCYLEPRVIYY